MGIWAIRTVAAMKTMKNNRLKTFFKLLKLNLLFLMYSAIAVLAKFAAKEDVFSLPFFLYMGAVIAILFVYAVLWQQILKTVPLTVAYSSKAVTVIWGIFFGIFIFGEQVTAGTLLGSVMIIEGIIIISFNKGNILSNVKKSDKEN